MHHAGSKSAFSIPVFIPVAGLAMELGRSWLTLFVPSLSFNECQFGERCFQLRNGMVAGPSADYSM